MDNTELKQKFKNDYGCNILYWSDTIKEHYTKWLEDRIIYLEKKLERELKK